MKGGSPVADSSPGGYLSRSADMTSPGDTSLVNQVSYLKNKLEDEHTNYKRKLQAYQDGQQRQAQLIQKLQQKVLQYKRKCGELETSMNETKTNEEDARKKVFFRVSSMRKMCFFCMCS